ncbi:putative lipid II flippase FtsW [Ideonella livida]|uniref:Probable peptidoglycan glycosyltransferase FtsW n=1 Tax=Ideonella livida TaxID=2707176 RepID=A0A7C9TL16_9BURK|nr:putative lipid II flippase FtsW [Ideonella livida]NDY92282.1 putative lipid II flippase FtsW [Ideonella livida]
MSTPTWRERWQDWRTRLAAQLSPEGGQGLPIAQWMPAGLNAPVSPRGFDQGLVWVSLSLIMLGIVMVYSASVALPDGPRFAGYTELYFLTRQTIAAGLGAVLALLAVRVPIAVWQKITPWLFIFTLVLLVGVLLFGTNVNKSKRWIRVAGFNFQPSELAKLTMAMYAASYMVRKMDLKESFTRAVLPMAAALAVLGVLLLAEPDMGAFVVISAVALGVLFLGGVNGKGFIISALVLLAAFAGMIFTSEERMSRLKSTYNPFEKSNAAGPSYQLVQSLMAFGRGEWSGAGLGGSLGKLHYLPEAHTDFLLAITGEELGLVGVTVVIAAFFWLTRRMFVIGRQAIRLDRVYAGLLAQGIGIWFAVQALINMGVNLGALPTKGLTLPMLSYGGSGLVLNMVALAIVLRVDVENRQLSHGGRV